MSVPVEILLVEDNMADADLIRDKMKGARLPHHVHVIGDGVGALNFLRRREGYASAPRPDLVLLDLNLPMKDGRDVLREIKDDEKLKVIPVVVLTSSDAEEDVARSYELHANAYVQKPTNLAGYRALIGAIDDFWLGIARLPKEDAA